MIGRGAMLEHILSYYLFLFLIPGLLHMQQTLQNPEMFNVIDSNGIERADRAFPMLVTTLLPVGIKGLVAVV